MQRYLIIINLPYIYSILLVKKYKKTRSKNEWKIAIIEKCDLFKDTFKNRNNLSYKNIFILLFFKILKFKTIPLFEVLILAVNDPSVTKNYSFY